VQPERITGILASLDESRLLDLCVGVRGREVTKEELLTCHEADHVKTYGGTKFGAWQVWSLQALVLKLSHPILFLFRFMHTYTLLDGWVCSA
jgi:hypothetical protein